MSKLGHNFPPSGELPIPEDVQPGPGWTDVMLDLADEIGPYLTLLLIERFGGQTLYIPADPARNPFRDIVGPANAARLSHLYKHARFSLPTGKFALARARRQGLIRAARAKLVTVSEAARKIGTSRTYLSELVNNSDEATGNEPVPERSSRRDPNQLHLFGDPEDED